MAGATVLVAETRRARPHGPHRRGRCLPHPPRRPVSMPWAGVASGLAEGELTAPGGAPALFTLEPGAAITAADLALAPLTPPLLPPGLASGQPAPDRQLHRHRAVPGKCDSPGPRLCLRP